MVYRRIIRCSTSSRGVPILDTIFNIFIIDTLNIFIFDMFNNQIHFVKQVFCSSSIFSFVLKSSPPPPPHSSPAPGPLRTIAPGCGAGLVRTPPSLLLFPSAPPPRRSRTFPHSRAKNCETGMGYPIPVLQFFNEPHCHGRSIWVLLQFWQLLLTSQITKHWLMLRGLAIQWFGSKMCFYGCDIREMRNALSLHAVADVPVFR